MILVRRLARPMLAAPFIAAGIEAFKHPVTTEAVSERAARGLAARIPKIPEMEVETAVRMGARLIVVVMRNGQYGTIAMHQLRQTGRMSAVTIGEVDIAGLATSLGATGVPVGRDRPVAP